MNERPRQALDWTPPDQKARDQIRYDLDRNILVEAGAGSGKTTAMVGRMIELIRSGTAEMEQIAAVTFTRKAAAELRERFQEKLEEEFRTLVEAEDGAEAAVRERVSRALRDLDRCYVGTIHSFCARLLRERPLEAGVPPNFEEVSGLEEDRLRAEAWSGFLDRLAARPSSRLARRLLAVGLASSQLRGLFRQLSDNPDVHFPAHPVPFPAREAIQSVRERLGTLLDRSLEMLPAQEPAAGWDKLQAKVRSLKFSRHFGQWEDDVEFLNVLVKAFGRNEAVQNRWGVDSATKAAARALCEDWKHFEEEGLAAHRLRTDWLACRYPVAIRFARAAAGIYAAERLRSGRLTFQDLLLLTARLLRERPDVRHELGRRYRYLLIDEFQDTDPLQAEVVFLLASEPESGDRWSEVEPRPGALFVVGDPKQSIYRFRRADIALYGQVKSRFRQVGTVVELIANFRSTQPVERFVNLAFRGPLPAEENRHQAAFAPLRVRPGPRPQQGIYWYRFEPAPGRGQVGGKRIQGPESELLASWIAERIDRKERRAGDFLVLTRRKKVLATYARALEQRNVPVQVTGAGIGVEEELSDLVLILEALCDPGNEVLTLAVLEGLFYGLSHEELFEHARLGGRFSFLRSDQPDGSPAAPALAQLHQFWRMSRSAPADVVVPSIVGTLGVLPFAAAGELGESRAGALLYAMDALRVAGLDGATSLVEAVEILRTALDEDEAEAPLFPGEGDVVRLMNLHKAKGLEAPVVILADPSRPSRFPVDRHITRDAEGRAVGYLLVQEDTGFASQCVARPPQWERHEDEEIPFGEAEEVRLLYVAATRARDELVIGRCSNTEDDSFWAPLHPALDDPSIARELSIEVLPPVDRERMTVSAEELVQATEDLVQTRASLAAPSYLTGSVTGLAKGEEGFVAAGSAGAGARGVSWGTAVHRVLELAGRGLRAAELRSACREILIEVERIDERGEPTEVETLLALVASVRASELWRRAEAATRRHVEVPFLVGFSGDDAEALRRIVPPDPEAPDAERLVEGVIDLAFLEEGRGWVIADYKTDVFGSDEAREARTAAYRRQVDLYALCWERLTGEPVVERQLYFTAEQPVVW
jgi:ATP-dependent helicase/nuclease subunit A